MIHLKRGHDRRIASNIQSGPGLIRKALVRLQLILLAHTLDSDVQAARPFPNELFVFPWELEHVGIYMNLV